MIIPTKKLNSGFELPIYGFGTWGVGGKHEPDPQNDDTSDINSIRSAVNHGVYHIDTAESYAAGHAEELVGQAIASYDRSKLFITSKVKDYHLKYDDVIRSCKASIKRLNTEYLDLYLIHKPSTDIPIKETMKAFNDLYRDGLIKNIGVSNFTKERFVQAQEFSESKIVINQLHLNLIYRESEIRGLLKFCRDNDVMFVAWRPVEAGLLVNNNEPILKFMCEKYQKTPSQIAINWLVSQENVVVLCRTTNDKHLEENLGALSWKMSPEDIENLRLNFPNQKAISDTVPLI